MEVPLEIALYLNPFHLRLASEFNPNQERNSASFRVKKKKILLINLNESRFRCQPGFARPGMSIPWPWNSPVERVTTPVTFPPPDAYGKPGQRARTSERVGPPARTLHHASQESNLGGT